MTLDAPGEDADLVEVIGQTGLRRLQEHHVLGHFVVGSGGIRIGDLGKHVGAYDALAFGILRHRIGHIHVDAPGQQPADMALAIADQPPVFHAGGRCFELARKRRGGGSWLGDRSGCLSRRLGARVGRGSLAGRHSLSTGSRGLRLGRLHARKRHLGDRSPGEKLQLGVRRHQHEVVRLAAGSNVQVDVVAQNSSCDHRVVLVLLGKLGEGIV